MGREVWFVSRDQDPVRYEAEEETEGFVLVNGRDWADAKETRDHKYCDDLRGAWHWKYMAATREYIDALDVSLEKGRECKRIVDAMKEQGIW